MAIKPSGPLAINEIGAEFKAGAPFSLSQFYRGGQYVPNSPATQNIPTAGAISFSQFYGASDSYYFEFDSGANVNLFDQFAARFGNPGGLAVTVVIKLNPGAVIGGSGQNALTIGQFPSGSVLTIDNYASIQGFGGGASATGGSAVNGEFGGQIMTLNNHGQMFAGGGGGGYAGTGGQGGPGQYQGADVPGPNEKSACDDTCDSSCVRKWGAGYFCPAANCSVESFCTFRNIPDAFCERCYKRGPIVSTTGGPGGGGGGGGVGQGYNQARAAGASGAGGQPGGQNAGTGGQGGTGGTGGDWGQAGATGETGRVGGNGNVGGGGGGTPGAGGAGPGYYLIKGGANLTFNNYGSIAGGLA